MQEYQSGPVNLQAGFLELKKRIDEQERTVTQIQRSLCFVLRLLGDLATTETLIRSLPSPSIGSTPEDFLASVERLRQERSDRARDVLFSVYLPHLRVVRSRFEEKKERVASLIGSWSVACEKKKTSDEWVTSLNDTERHLWRSVDKDPLPREAFMTFRYIRRALPLDRRGMVAVQHVSDPLFLWKLMFQSRHPSLLATQLMLPALLGRQGYYKVQKGARGMFHPFSGALPSLNLIAPLNPNFLASRRHVLSVLWQAAIANPRIAGKRHMCRWIAAASHVADRETVEMITAHLAKTPLRASWVARRIESFHLRSSGRVTGSGAFIFSGWHCEPSLVSERHLRSVRELPTERLSALIASQAERVCECSDAMRRFLSDSLGRPFGGIFGDRFSRLRIVDAKGWLMSAFSRPLWECPLVLWYIDLLESKVAELEIKSRRKDPEEMIEVVRRRVQQPEDFEGEEEEEENGVEQQEDPQDEHMSQAEGGEGEEENGEGEGGGEGEGYGNMRRVIDVALLRACAIGLPRLTRTLLSYGANPNVSAVRKDEGDPIFFCPPNTERFDAVCRSAVQAMNSRPRLGFPSASDFCRNFAVVRELVLGGGKPYAFLDIVDKVGLKRFVDNRDVDYGPVYGSPFVFTSRPLRLQPKVVRFRVLLRLFAEPSLRTHPQPGSHCDEEGRGASASREHEGEMPVEEGDSTGLLQRLHTLAEELCEHDRASDPLLERVPPPHELGTEAHEQEEDPDFSSWRARESISSHEMLLLNRSLKEAWHVVQKWGLAPPDGKMKTIGKKAPSPKPSLADHPSAPKTAKSEIHFQSLCESLFLSFDSNYEI
uniref:Uncharacterized protein n=1 Tax=Chromera velia CCMP2878 TaxID=1169474 RepID=A0A0G4I5Q6_9ALVE|eukprot:Cvel_11165.t1-p1 / transcript=Cvel_11165.t1 / gene=Cvel_11165 / organism=Chromera_velia_CCMP2878 / gene_product=hypothetical protein / transcript_product=hypothetical protein / location=Cvel_scaffold693:8900-11377(+) / protein_length=826 / sequence_SO=supercontig / SO=protein_coding / is_pseudo=false